VQEADPACVLKVPMSHNEHVPNPSGPVVPALQVHTFEIELITVEDFPVPHTVHAADPASAL
jgi:hypothetical protein